MIPRRLPQALMIAASLTLAACGGGGGSSRNNNPPPSNSAPSASFTVSPDSGTAPLDVSVDASASSDSDGSISSYSWDWGDGSAASSGATASHTYQTGGDFTITLTVTDNGGATGSTTRAVSSQGFTLSGSISILSSSAADSDVNDQFTTPVSNDSFDDAQDLLNPVTLGGFVTVVDGCTDASSNLCQSGDLSDYYRVALAGDEHILVTVGESSADIDVVLYDESRTMVDASVSGPGLTESLEVSVEGLYFVEIQAIAGASNYVLTIGQNVTTTSAGKRAATRVSDNFVPGELLVSSNTSSRALPRSVAAANLGNAGSIKRVKLAADAASNALAFSPRNTRVPFNTRSKIPAHLYEKYQTLMAAKLVTNDPSIDVAEPNLLHQPLLEPNDPFYDYQWHYESVNLPLAWDITTGSSDVIVAVVDTGVLTAHPDLTNQLVDGFDFISDTTRSGDGDGIDDNPNDDGDQAYPNSSSFHGTHVAGTVAAQSNNGSGAAGVAWGARIMPMRALGVGGGTSFDVIQAVRYAAGLSNDSGTTPATPADIINLSLGSSASSQLEQDTLNEVRNLGIFVVSAAGNDGTNTPNFPAAYNGVISVTATGINNTVAPYSNSGSTVDLAAPGGNVGTDLNADGFADGVISTMGDDSNAPITFGYAPLAGTSMAAPHVAGVIALMKSVYPGLTPDEFDTALAAGDITDDLGAAGRDDVFGHGLLNAQKAVLTALDLLNGSGGDPGPILAASISTLNLGFATNSDTVAVRNVGSGTLTIAAATSNQPWLTVTPATVDGNGLGDYTISIDRGTLDVGTYSGTVTFDSDANDVTVQVIMQVLGGSPQANAGQHYVIVVDAEGEPVNQLDVATLNNGVYTFTIEDVPAGEFRIFAGSDLDDDFFICDAGEACGAYQTLDSPDQITVSGDLTGLDFFSGYRVNVTNLSTGGSAASTGFRYDRNGEKESNKGKRLE